MRNFLFFVGVASLLFAACAGTKPMALNFSPEANTTFTYRSSVEMVNNVKVMGMDQNTTMNQETEVEYVINKIAADGSTDLTMTTKNVMVEQSMPMMSIVFDSKNPERNEPAEMANTFKNVVGHQYEVSLDANGKVKSIESESGMFDGAFDDNPQGAAIAEQMEGMLGKQAMQQAFDRLTGFYPEQPVKVGDTWNVKSEISAGMQLKTDINYTLKSRSNGIAVITFDGDLMTDPNGEPLEMMGMSIKYNLKGKQTGEMTVDEKTGWAITSEGVQEMKGTVGMSGEALGGMDMNADMEMNNKFKTEKIK